MLNNDQDNIIVSSPSDTLIVVSVGMKNHVVEHNEDGSNIVIDSLSVEVK